MEATEEKGMSIKFEGGGRRRERREHMDSKKKQDDMNKADLRKKSWEWRRYDVMDFLYIATFIVVFLNFVLEVAITVQDKRQQRDDKRCNQKDVSPAFTAVILNGFTPFRRNGKEIHILVLRYTNP